MKWSKECFLGMRKNLNIKKQVGVCKSFSFKSMQTLPSATFGSSQNLENLLVYFYVRLESFDGGKE